MIMAKVSTGKLRDGDIVILWGARIKIEGKPNVTIGPGGRTIFRYPNMPIIAGMIKPFSEATQWTVQGSDFEYWTVAR